MKKASGVMTRGFFCALMNRTWLVPHCSCSYCTSTCTINAPRMLPITLMSNSSKRV